VHSTIALFLAWSVAGVAMAMTMYDAAFATLSQHSGPRYRKALTALTLMGGLASTAFWPASLKGLEWFGWRDTLLIFAALEIASACRCICFSFRRAPVRSITAKRALRKGAAAFPRPSAARLSSGWRSHLRSTALLSPY
jgi:MFS family permease